LEQEMAELTTHLRKINHRGGSQKRKGPGGKQSANEYINGHVDALFKTGLFKEHLPPTMDLPTF
jgi:hypothetical protein